MTSHLVFPIKWVECSNAMTCEKSLHVDMDDATLNDTPLEWVESLIPNCRISENSVEFRDGEDRLHRLDGPASEWSNGTLQWRLNGNLHRENGPAIVFIDGSEQWYLDNKRHRVDGPAVIKADGTLEWWKEGVQHRLNGPAVIRPNGRNQWWLNGKPVKAFT